MQYTALNLSLTAIVSITNVILATLVYKNNPKGLLNRIFVFLSLFVTLGLISMYISTDRRFLNSVLFWIRASIFFAIPQSLSIYVLSKVFPSGERLDIKKISTLATLGFLIMVLTLTPLVFKGVEIDGRSVKAIPGPGLLVFISYVIGTSFSAIYILLKKFKKSVGIEREQLRYVSAGILLMFGLIIFTILLPVALFKTSFFVSFFSFYTLIFTSMTAYAIAKHRFLDIRSIAGKAVTFTIFFGIVSVIFVSLVLLIGSILFPISLEPKEKIVLTLLIVILGTVLDKVRVLVETITDRVFFQGRYNSEELLARLNIIMAENIDLDDLTHKVLSEIIREMRILKGAFILISDNKIYDVKTEGYKKNPLYIEAEILKLAEANRPMVYEDVDDYETKQVMRIYDISYYAPLISSGKVLGIFSLGGKASGDVYSSQDIDVLTILVPELTIAIRNSIAYEEIRRFSITLKEEVERATRELREANRKLQELDELKDEFVSVASHELRTPMTSIKSYLWMALNKVDREEIPEKMAKYLDRAFKATDRLIKMVNNMLNIGRIETGKMKYEKKLFDVKSLIEEVIAEVSPKAKELKIKIQYKVPKRPVFARADKDKTHEVLINLIGNSLKFTKKGGKVSVEAANIRGRVNRGRRKPYVKISVTDTGIGLDSAEIKNLFKKFGRLEGSYEIAKAKSGSGLGLYISKQYVEKMGGEIGVRSPGKGRGSTFYFTLPGGKRKRR